MHQNHLNLSFCTTLMASKIIYLYLFLYFGGMVVEKNIPIEIILGHLGTHGRHNLVSFWQATHGLLRGL